MFGSCPSAISLEDALGKINLVTAEDANEPMSIQFQEDVNSFRLAQRSDPCYVSFCNGQTLRNIQTKIRWET